MGRVLNTCIVDKLLVGKGGMNTTNLVQLLVIKPLSFVAGLIFLGHLIIISVVISRQNRGIIRGRNTLLVVVKEWMTKT